MSWQQVRLDSVAIINPRTKQLEQMPDDTMVSFVPMAAVSEATFTIEAEETRQLRDVSKGYTPFQPNDVLLAKITPCFENGKLAVATIKHEYGYGSTEFHVIRADPNKILPKYIYHYLRQDQIRFVGEKRMTGSAGQRRVPAAFLQELQIPLPPLAEQRRIAAILDCADALRAKRRAALAKLDTLLQATFLDMFGDPVTNPMGWEYHQLNKYFSENKEGTKCGPFGSALKREEYVDAGIPVWIMDNIQSMMFDPNGSLYITPQKYEQLRAYSATSGDIIISRAGTVGKMCVVENDVSNSIISTNLIRLSLNEKLLDPYYFVSLMTFCKGRVGRLKTGEDGAYSFMNTGILTKLVIPIPPIDVQKRYRQILFKIRDQKMAHEQDLLVLDALFHSLQQRAFRGELGSGSVVVGEAEAYIGQREEEQGEQLRLWAE